MPVSADRYGITRRIACRPRRTRNRRRVESESMHLDGSYTFDAPRQRVWETLQSPTVISQCMPGCEKFEEIGQDRYEATMRIGIGPIKGTYTGRIHLRD